MPFNDEQNPDPLNSLEPNAAPLRQVRNNAWARDAFFVPRLTTNSTAKLRKAYNSSIHKFYDSSVGGNAAINPAPGFTPTADPRPDMVIGKPNSHWLMGMGSYYSEAIDDNQENLSLQFGVPQFNSLSTFFSNYYDSSVAQMVKNGGIIEDTMFTVGRVTGVLLTLPFQALFGLNTLYNRLSSVLTGAPYSKFYYMNPTMPLYLNTAQNLVTALATNMFMAPSLRDQDVGSTTAKSDRFNGNQSNRNELSALAEVLPEIYDAQSGINVFAIVTRAQRMANNYQEHISKAIDSGDRTKVLAAVTDANSGAVNLEESSFDDFNDYLSKYRTKHPSSTVVAEPTVSSETKETVPQDTGSPTLAESPVRKEPGFKEFFDAERRDGSAFVTFRTTKQDGGTDSFNNGTKPAPLEEKINGFASAARDLGTNFAGGNLVGGPGDIINTAVKAITGFVSGAASSIGFDPVSATLSGANIEMPEVYDSSSLDFGSNSFNLKLHSVYGDKASIFMNIYIPLCLLLAGVLPRATGKASHMAPFLCRAYSPGKLDIKLGMIESLTLTKFTGNINKSIDDLPTQIDVSLKIKNMDKIITAPVADSLFNEAIGFSAFDEDTALTDYLSALSGLSLYDQYYLSKRVELKWSRTVAQWQTLTSAASMANYVGGTTPGKLISALSAPGALI